MSCPENFVSIDYGKIGFLISKSQLWTATSCSSEDFTFEDEMRFFKIADRKFPVIDFDICTEEHFYSSVCDFHNLSTSSVRTCLIIKGGLFKDYEAYALVTSAECRLFSFDLKEFRLLSGLYAESYVKKGILALKFEDDGLRYLIDAEDYLRKALC